jgi:hypothetical protein
MRSEAMSTTTTIRVHFMSGDSLSTRNAHFREARLLFDSFPRVVLVREGYGDVPLATASNVDVMFATAAILTGTLKPTAKVILS